MYGWIIDALNEDLFEDSELGTSGPSNISQEMTELLSEGSGEKFKMFDDDGIWYYTGRIVGDYDGFEPLYDFGMPNAGASNIEYMVDGLWRTL